MNINNSVYFNYFITYLFILRKKSKKKDNWVLLKWPSFNNFLMIIVLLNTNAQKY